MTTRILVVCLGNTCRSPLGQGVLERLAAEAGLAVEIDSAGIGAWHVGNPPNPNSAAIARARGYDISAQRSRQIAEADFHRFDLILGMDRQNIADLRRLCPPGASPRIRLFRPDDGEVPDPYTGGPEDYRLALDLIEEAAAQITRELAGETPGA